MVKVKVEKQLEKMIGMRDNIERKKSAINEVVLRDGVPLFSFVELNINELCNRTCAFCPRHNPKKYPNQNLHMNLELAENIASQLEELNFTGIVNISGTGEPLLTKHISDIVKKFGDRNIHIEVVTNGDKLCTELIKDLYGSGLTQLVISMYDGPEQIKHFNSLFLNSGIDSTSYTLRERWHNEDEDYGLLYTNRTGAVDSKLQNIVHRPCYYTHYAMYIDWNGDVLLCCQDMYNRTVKFGNIKDKPLLDIWTDKHLINYRKKLKNGDRSESPCSNCNVYGIIFGSSHAKAW